MRKLAFVLVAAAVATALVVGLATRGSGPSAASASSHREAPLISEDPSADGTDLYAFRSPDKPDTFTVLANYIPAEDPAAGPNYYTLSPFVRYNIYLDTNGDGKPDTTYRFRFERKTGPFFLGDTVQPYTVTKIQNGKSTVVARGETPPDNIGPRTTPNYHSLAASKVTQTSDGGLVFAGQRDDAFFADIGAIFDLVAIRKDFTSGGKDFFAGYGVHTLALQLPISAFDNGTNHVVGVWTTSERRSLTVGDNQSRRAKLRKRSLRDDNPWVQVSRLGNPLVNEVIIPTGKKDKWNRTPASAEEQFLTYYENPILAQVINQLYHVGAPETGRDDLVAILLTGVPGLNNTGTKHVDELRLNLSTPVTPPDKVSRLGVLGGDVGGYPNGRRLDDDVIDIDEQAVAGFLKGNKVPLGDGVNANDVPDMASFPYEADPFSGFANTKGEQKP
jgi:uncharacterized protein DUF4331